jgi:epoxyqueuosine reductase
MINREQESLAVRARKIKERVLGEGFTKVGIVPAEKLVGERAHLEEWLARSFHGGMKWMARDAEKRTDPRAIFAEARSIVCVALNYYTPYEHTDDPMRGKISRYAWGDDYHDVITDKLKNLLAWIKAEWSEAEGKTCVDIQPMMDKAWAVRAGLGWIGKHSNLITREYGSWVFLGELILNLDLVYDTEQEADHCGSCTLCLETCPTGAITEPYVVDSNKCISYATIELRADEMPVDVAENARGWLYGCDICQDVCPWNRFEQPSDEERFAPRYHETSFDLEKLLDLTHEEYSARFRRSAIKRAKLGGLQRNARALLEYTASKKE